MFALHCRCKNSSDIGGVSRACSRARQWRSGPPGGSLRPLATLNLLGDGAGLRYYRLTPVLQGAASRTSCLDLWLTARAGRRRPTRLTPSSWLASIPATPACVQAGCHWLRGPHHMLEPSFDPTPSMRRSSTTASISRQDRDRAKNLDAVPKFPRTRRGCRRLRVPAWKQYPMAPCRCAAAFWLRCCLRL